MPLTMAKTGEINSVKRVEGGEKTKKFLESLGLIVGSHITIISKNNGNVIAEIKGSRIAVSCETANKIFV